MEVFGKVLEQIDEKRIKVEVERISACGGNCHSCGSCGAKQSVIVAECSDKVLAQELVKVVIPSQRFFLLSFFVFIVPLATIVAGYMLFSSVLPETAASVVSFLFGVAAFLLIILMLRKLKMPKAYKINQTKED